MKSWVQRLTLCSVLLGLGCLSPRLYYVWTELPHLENDAELAVVPGPWKRNDVPVVISDAVSPPDDLVLSTLRALMSLPGAVEACDPNSGTPRTDASEYCVAIYKTPQDWRVSWPIRELTGESSSCQPPFGGVDDEDFGRDLPIFGFAHNHPCGANMSSPDLSIFPALKTGEGLWTMVSYATTPSGRLARDSSGSLIPAWHWLATGRVGAPRFLKWNPAGEVFLWMEGKRTWEFQATCRPQTSSMIGRKILPPQCTPELTR